MIKSGAASAAVAMTTMQGSAKDDRPAQTMGGQALPCILVIGKAAGGENLIRRSMDKGLAVNGQESAMDFLSLIASCLNLS